MGKVIQFITPGLLGWAVATGAHSHDHWFAWEPTTDGEEFAAKVGL